MEGVAAQVRRDIHAYLSRTDNNAASRSYWFWTQARTWIWPRVTVALFLVCAGHLRVLALLISFRSTFTFTSTRCRGHWIRLTQWLLEQFGAAFCLSRSSHGAFALHDVICIGEGPLHGLRSSLRWGCSRAGGVFASFEWRLKLRPGLQHNWMEILFWESRFIKNASWKTNRSSVKHFQNKTLCCKVDNVGAF